MLVQEGNPLAQKYGATEINKLSKETILYLTFFAILTFLCLNFALREFCFTPLDYISNRKCKTDLMMIYHSYAVRIALVL